MAILTRDLEILGEFLVVEFARELSAQGHRAAGRLIQSLESKVVIQPTGLFLEISFFDYGLFVDRGRKPGGKKVPIAALIEWIKERAIANGQRDIKRIAFAIQTNIWKFGIPTPNSKKFSRSGKRTGWFTDTLAAQRQTIEQEISNSAFKRVDSFIDDLVKDANKQLA